jgi:hypothetical protein
MLLHLCFDDEYRAGLEKAFAVVASALQPGDDVGDDARIPMAALGDALFRGAAPLDLVQQHVVATIGGGSGGNDTVSCNELIDRAVECARVAARCVPPQGHGAPALVVMCAMKAKQSEFSGTVVGW